MHPGRAVSWYRRMSVVYALGTWTLLGSVFYKFGQKKKKATSQTGSEMARAFVLVTCDYKQSCMSIILC
ncbi:hypothetical protein SUZIE_203670 [Sciurus carolinensis]|uniref:Small integral membrane protein 26 n=1 Tax=Sciurus carolinensis TaxID=30640 RepID=A0AA41NFT7_SCICA|nr:hypothetical protein [Sciurus carolinensis]